MKANKNFVIGKRNLLTIIVLVATIIFSAKIGCCQSLKPATIPVKEILPVTIDVNKIDAKLVEYTVKYRKFWLLIREDMSNYKRLQNSPLTAALFVMWFNRSSINQISVKSLMSGHLGDSDKLGDKLVDLLVFENIVGLESLADSMKMFDEFEMTSRKAEIVSRIARCYDEYYAEYRDFFIENDGYFVFENFNTNSRMKSYDYDIGKHIQKLCSIKRDDYNFDTKTLRLPLLGPGGNGSPNNAIEIWEDCYRKIYYGKYKKELPYEISVPLALDDAKKLFGEQSEVVCRHNVVVKIKPGLAGETSFYDSMTTSFEIMKIGIACYSDANAEEPNLRFEITPTASMPLY